MEVSGASNLRGVTDAPVIRIVAAVILNPMGHMLLVRKRGTTAYMQPGGKFEDGETGHDAVIRELQEELGFELVENDLEYVGRYHAKAANEVGHLVDSDVFFTVVETDGVVAAEIEELLWIDPRELHTIEDLAPLTGDVLRQYILTMSAAIQGRREL
jgi:8-oxo-dGTP diphosphatase